MTCGEFGGLVERTVLLGLLAIACERLWKGVRGRRRVDLGCVVNLCAGALAKRAIGICATAN